MCGGPAAAFTFWRAAPSVKGVFRSARRTFVATQLLRTTEAPCPDATLGKATMKTSATSAITKGASPVPRRNSATGRNLRPPAFAVRSWEAAKLVVVWGCRSSRLADRRGRPIYRTGIRRNGRRMRVLRGRPRCTSSPDPWLCTGDDADSDENSLTAFADRHLRLRLGSGECRHVPTPTLAACFRHGPAGMWAHETASTARLPREAATPGCRLPASRTHWPHAAADGSSSSGVPPARPSDDPGGRTARNSWVSLRK